MLRCCAVLIVPALATTIPTPEVVVIEIPLADLLTGGVSLLMIQAPDSTSVSEYSPPPNSSVGSPKQSSDTSNYGGSLHEYLDEDTKDIDEADYGAFTPSKLAFPPPKSYYPPYIPDSDDDSDSSNSSPVLVRKPPPPYVGTPRLQANGVVSNVEAPEDITTVNPGNLRGNDAI